MTTSVTAAGRPAPGATAVEWLTQWVKDHKRAAAYIAAVLAIAAALFVWNLLSTRTAERSAGRQLEQGRLALASRNYQLAASVLSQVTENYAGTHAAQDGALLRGVRAGVVLGDLREDARGELVVPGRERPLAGHRELRRHARRAGGHHPAGSG